MRQKQIPRPFILSALERLRHAQSCIRHGDVKSISPRLQGHSSDFIYGALWALQWVAESGGDVDAGPCGKLSKDVEDPRFTNDRLPDGSLPLRFWHPDLPEVSPAQRGREIPQIHARTSHMGWQVVAALLFSLLLPAAVQAQEPCKVNVNSASLRRVAVRRDRYGFEVCGVRFLEGPALFGCALHGEYAGYLFWLSRCGHGAGFFDLDEIPDEIRDRLQGAARAAGERYAYIGDDGELYIA